MLRAESDLQVLDGSVADCSDSAAADLLIKVHQALYYCCEHLHAGTKINSFLISLELPFNCTHTRVAMEHWAQISTLGAMLSEIGDEVTCLLQAWLAPFSRMFVLQDSIFWRTLACTSTFTTIALP